MPVSESPAKRDATEVASPVKEVEKRVKLTEEEPTIVEDLPKPEKDEAEIKTDQFTLRWAKLSENAEAPTRGSKLAAGFDLKSAYDLVIPKRGAALVKTDIQVQIPYGHYGRVAPRSGLALKNKLDVGGGVIDADYRGNVGVILFNHADEDFTVVRGDRVAQLILEQISYAELVEVKTLDETARGEKGFGSTGVSETEQKDVAMEVTA